MDEPRCHDCGTPEKLHHKFNGGNPIDVWLPECDCEERRLDEELARRGLGGVDHDEVTALRKALNGFE